eukprot:TRINITY_DN11565_c0_g1_i1.p1 TRINITY_DN11565_c0_g1~~TRINITY_DN11565_c0_g1_i1.p1  ORF type:complete len:384 (+),score=71.88 TRINITY_DN11565_c0_g1_i1:78-1229(+)
MPRSAAKPDPVYTFSPVTRSEGFEARAMLRKLANHDDYSHAFKSCVQENGTADYPCAFIANLPGDRTVLYRQYHLRCKQRRDSDPALIGAPASDVIVYPVAQLAAEFQPVFQLITEDFDSFVPGSVEKFKWCASLLRKDKSARHFVTSRLLPLLETLSFLHGTSTNEIRTALTSNDPKALRKAISEWIQKHHAEPQPDLHAYHGRLQEDIPASSALPALQELPAELQQPQNFAAVPALEAAAFLTNELHQNNIAAPSTLYQPPYDPHYGPAADSAGFETSDEISFGADTDAELFSLLNSDHLDFGVNSIDEQSLVSDSEHAAPERVKRSYSEFASEDDDVSSSKRTKISDDCAFPTPVAFGAENLHHNLGCSAEWPLTTNLYW